MTVTFCTGVMGAGKSKQLIDDFNLDEKKKIAVAVSLDGEVRKIESRNGKSILAHSFNVGQQEESFSYLEMIYDNEEVESVYIDETQFLSAEIVFALIELFKKKNTDIHFYGLDRTFLNEDFQSSSFLISFVGEKNVKRIPMTCQVDGCERFASHNARIFQGKVLTDGELFISDKDSYLSICSLHYFE